MSSPIISVLIPVYNRKAFIGECIQSVLDQNYTDFEIVVIDNASDDGTMEICQKYQAMDDRIQLFHNSTNIGPLKNLITGISKCNGNYIKILFSDDLLQNSCLEQMVAALENNPDAAIVISNVSTINDGFNKKEAMYNFNSTKIKSCEYIKSVILNNTMPLSPGACLFRNNDLRNNYKSEIYSPVDRKIEEHGAGPDLLSMMLTAYEYEYVCLINEPLNIFREHSGSLSISKSGKNLSDCYVQCKVNFSLQYYAKPTLYVILSKIYLNRCMGYKSLITPSLFRRTFGISFSFFEALYFDVCIAKLVTKKITKRIFGK